MEEEDDDGGETWRRHLKNAGSQSCAVIGRTPLGRATPLAAAQPSRIVELAA